MGDAKARRHEGENDKFHRALAGGWERHNGERWGETTFRECDWGFFRIDQYWESLDPRGILNPRQDCGETTDNERQKEKEKVFQGIRVKYIYPSKWGTDGHHQ